MGVAVLCLGCAAFVKQWEAWRMITVCSCKAQDSKQKKDLATHDIYLTQLIYSVVNCSPELRDEDRLGGKLS